MTVRAFARGLFPLLRGAGLAHSIQDGTPAVYPKVVVGVDMGQELLADGAFQMNQSPAGYAFEVEVVTAIPSTHVLIDVSRLGITAIFSHRPLIAELGQVTIQTALTALPIPGSRSTVQFPIQFIHGKLAVGIALQKIQKPLPSRSFISPGHSAPPNSNTNP